MNKILLTLSVVCLLQFSLATEQENNSIDNEEVTTSETPEIDFGPAQNIIAGIYRRAAVQALQSKITELQTKLWNGQNPVPAAMDILRLTIFSNPAQDTLKKAADHVLSLMSPEVKKLAVEAVAAEAIATEEAASTTATTKESS